MWHQEKEIKRSAVSHQVVRESSALSSVRSVAKRNIVTFCCCEESGYKENQQDFSIERKHLNKRPR
jgi:hypothetical protein